MNKFILAVVLITVGLVIAYTPPTGEIVGSQGIPEIVFTNGWVISCSGTNVIFTAP